jgi:cysteine desulfurase/selenocysteine lyase
MNASVQPVYDVERIRADFPILAQQHRGNPLVFLDSGASRRSRAR